MNTRITLAAFSFTDADGIQRRVEAGTEIGIEHIAGQRSRLLLVSSGASFPVSNWTAAQIDRATS